MPESELAKRLTGIIKVLDKLVSDIKKDTQAVSAAVKELKELGNKEKND